MLFYASNEFLPEMDCLVFSRGRDFSLKLSRISTLLFDKGGRWD